MQQRLKPIFIVILLFLIPACVEHTFFIQVHPAGNFDIDYHARGDRGDLLDADFCIPHDSTWHVVTTLDVEDAESYEYSASKWFAANESVPDTYFEGDSIAPGALLRTPTKLQRRRWLLNNTYVYQTIFKGRGVSDKYPALAESLKNNNDIDWIHETLVYFFRETLRRSDVGFNREPILQKELGQWLDENVINLPDSILLENLEDLKQAGLELLKQPLEKRYYPVLDSIFGSLEEEARITHDLADDEFEFRVILPGEILDTNADTTRGDTMIWKVSLQNYMDEDYILTAKSRVLYPWRYRILIALLVVTVLLIFVKGVKSGTVRRSDNSNAKIY
ncbi:MAG: hypothetical protein GXO91_07030 [FCB group bacterium]|nr:hypothetical protein [FCB group bacterium]